MPLGFFPHTSGTRFAILLDEFAESGPGILAMDEVNGVRATADGGAEPSRGS